MTSCNLLKTNYCLKLAISVPRNKWKLSLKSSVHLSKLLIWLVKFLLSQALRCGIWFSVSFLSMALLMFPFNYLISPRKYMINWAFLELWPLDQSGRWSTLESYQPCPRTDKTWPSKINGSCMIILGCIFNSDSCIYPTDALLQYQLPTQEKFWIF